MRKLICVLLVVLICLGTAFGVWADDGSSVNNLQLVSESVEYYEDGSSLVISVYEETVQTRSNLYNRVGRKDYKYRDANGTVLWTFAVTGEFRVLEGASVTCISASCSAEVFHEAWVCTRKYAETSGSWAIANGEFERSLLGIVIDRDTVQVSLTCDVYGNLS